MTKNQREQLQSLIGILDAFTDFLRPFRLLVNTHNVQFIVDKLWHNEAYINADLRNDLELFIADCNQKEKPVNLVEYYMCLRDGVKNANANSFLDSLFDQLIKFNTVWHEQVLTAPEDLIRCDQESNLKEFTETVNRKFEVMVKQNRFMNAKKSYEVDEMSKFVAKLCKKLDVNTVRVLFRLFYMLSCKIYDQNN